MSTGERAMIDSVITGLLWFSAIGCGLIPAAPGHGRFALDRGEDSGQVPLPRSQEQLGLRLRPARDEVSVLVIDHIERLAPD